MTLLVYALWIAAALLLAGELDRMLQRRFHRWYESSFPAIAIWFVPPLASMFVPGFGQVLNRQILKGIVIVAWPILAGFRFFPRPWQLLLVPFGVILGTWYLVMISDALIAAFLSSRRQSLKAGATEVRANHISAYLERRRLRK